MRKRVWDNRIGGFCANIVQILCKTIVIRVVNALENQGLCSVRDDNSLQPVCKSTCNNDWGLIA